jgi:hypothetical protein
LPESSLNEGAEGNAGKTKADEVVVGGSGRRLAASNVLLALLADDVLDGDPDDGDLDRELGALLEETKTLGARSSTNEVGQGTSEETAVNVGAVTSVGGLVAAGQLSLVTALVLGLLDSHVAGDGEANVAVALVAGTVGVARAVVIDGGRRRTTGHGHDGGSESKNSSSDGELHCDGGFGIERELKLGVACKRALVWKDWTVRERKKANQRM